MIAPKPWTPADDAVMRARYIPEGPEVCAEALGRSWIAITRRAQRLRLIRVRRWLSHDDTRLTMLWGAHSVAKVASLLGRTPDAVYERARHLDLGLGCAQGSEYLSAAAVRTGYAVNTLRIILQWAGVRIDRAMARPSATRRGKARRKAHLTHVVEPQDVDEAVSRWCASEPLDAAAASRDVCSDTLARLLREAAARGDARVPAKPRRFRQHWRIPSVLADEIVASYARRESLSAAALRVRVWRSTLLDWLTRAGVRVVRAEKLDPADVDRVVAARLADPRCKAPARRAA